MEDARPLPSGWSKQFSNTHKREYWFNAADGTRSWVCPGVGEEEEQQHQAAPNKRPRVETEVTKAEDCPSLSLERARLLTECYEVFLGENEKFGEMGGNSKTAKACKRDGMRVGMQGMFGRIVWTQLLKHVQARGDIGTDPSSDAVFVPAPVVDAAVQQELVEAGRTEAQARGVMGALYARIRQACQTLVAAASATASSSSSSSSSSSTQLVALQGKLQADGQLHRDGNFMYRLDFGGTSHVISGTHLQKLLGLYRLHTAQPACPPADASFLRRTFCVLARYELLSGSSDGYQMAFPNVGFHWLRHNMGVTAECFASPLNCWNDHFCSVARDTDRFFGSMGNFFHLAPPEEGGSFEANPPFVESIMNEMADKIEQLLAAAAPFSFVVIVPAWTDCHGLQTMNNSRFLRPRAKYVLCLEKKKHNYRPGMQHRTEHAEQPSNVDTLVFFLQNDAGAKRWPVTEALAEELKRTVNIA